MTSPAPTENSPAHAGVQFLDLEEAADRLIGDLPGHRRRTENLARDSGVSVVLMAMEAGDVLEEHSTSAPVTVHLLRGHASLTIDETTYELRPGQLLLIQPLVPHDLRALQQSVLLLTVSAR